MVDFDVANQSVALSSSADLPEPGGCDTKGLPPQDGMTLTGRLRKKLRQPEEAAWSGWIVRPTRPSRGRFSRAIFGAISSAHAGARLAVYRDEGHDGKLLSQTAGPLRKSGLFPPTWCRVFESRSDHREALEALRNELNILLEHDESIPVMVPTSTREEMTRLKARMDKLHDRDKAGIKKMRQLHGHQSMHTVHPKQPRFSFFCPIPATVDPLQDIQQCRQFVYTVCAHLTLLPPDAWVDRYVLDLLNTRFGYQPETSLQGIRFHVPHRSRPGVLDSNRPLRVSPLRAKPTTVTSRESPDWNAMARRVYHAIRR